VIGNAKDNGVEISRSSIVCAQIIKSDELNSKENGQVERHNQHNKQEYTAIIFT